MERLLTQEAAPDHEVMVVDNNSNDSTKDAVEPYIAKFKGRLRYLFEPRQGKPFALNLGIKESRGEILAFTDDDCLVEKDHLAQVSKVFQESGIDFMGGKILPRWVGGECPSWISEVISDKTNYEISNEHYWRRIFFRGPLAILDYGEKPFRVDSAQKFCTSFLFYGPNMAVKKAAFDKVGGYDPKRFITQDTEICLRLIRLGMKGLYAPHVKVYHRVQAAEVTPEFYCRWYFERGKFLETNGMIKKKFYHPLGVQNALILKTCVLFLRSVAAPSVHDKVHYRCQTLFNLAQMGQIIKKNII